MDIKRELLPGYADESADEPPAVTAIAGAIAEVLEILAAPNHPATPPSSTFLPGLGAGAGAGDDALRRSVGLLRAVLDSTADGLLVVDRNGQVITCNTRFRELWGMRDETTTATQSELMAFVLDQLSDPDAALARVQALYADPASESFDLMDLNDGRRFECRSRPYHAADQRVGRVWSFRDVTRQQRAEQELRLAAEVFRSNADGIIITDATPRIVRVNRAFSRITGYEEGEVVGRNPAVLQSGRQDGEFYVSMWMQLKEKGWWQGELWNRRKNGEVFPEWLSISAVTGEDGRVAHYVGVFSDLTSRKAAEDTIQQLVYFDALTGLPNRLMTLDRLRQVCIQAEQREAPAAVMLVDIDRFQAINDSLGHETGDRVLTTIAERLLQCVRPSDWVSRHVGDEFALVIGDLGTGSDAAELADKVMAALAQPVSLPGQDLSVTASIGISVYPQDGDTAEQLLRAADAALHHAKRDGRNSVQFYRAHMNADNLQRLLLENSLRRALERNEFMLEYQPQVDLASNRIVGVEALVRWQHPEMGRVSPARFISLAEENGQIVAIGEWVLATACAQAKRWHDAGHGELKMAVNLSARQFRSKDLLQVIAHTLHETGLKPCCLELELTESMIMHDPERVTATLRELKALGVRVSVDDFGTGYSSLAYLKRFPIDKLKIDRSFVQDIPRDANDAAIAKAIIALGNSLQLSVVAEGVETQEQLDFLREHHCASMQGYFFSPPVGAEAFEALLARQAQDGAARPMPAPSDQASG